jgi:hypothetical protein
MINTKLQNIIDTKAAIGNAINNKGGSITAETPFYEYAPAIDNISSGASVFLDESKFVFITNGAGNTSSMLTNSGVLFQAIDNSVIAYSENNLSQLYNSALTGAGNTVKNIHSNDGFVYASYGNAVRKLIESNLTTSLTNTTRTLANVITSNDTFLFVGGDRDGDNDAFIFKIRESNLITVANTAKLRNRYNFMVAYNGLLYTSGNNLGNEFRQFFQSNLVLANNTALVNYTGTYERLHINDGFMYVGGNNATQGIVKYNADTLEYIGNTVSFSGAGSVNSIVTKDGFLYVGRSSSQTVLKFYEGNLAFAGELSSTTLGGGSRSILVNNGYILASASTVSTTKKYTTNINSLTDNGVDYWLIPKDLGVI